MSESRSKWPLLVYGVLVAIAAARSRQSHGLRVSESGGARGGSPPASYSAWDGTDETRREARPAERPESDKRPREQFENDQPISAQRRRANERGRGRRATAPWKIPWRGWKDILWRTYASVNHNRLLAVAAGVVFYSLLAMFPAIAAFVSLYGLVADASTIDAHLSLLSGVMPGGATDIVHEQVRKIADNNGGSLTLGFVLGLALALWSANAGSSSFRTRRLS